LGIGVILGVCRDSDLADIWLLTGLGPSTPSLAGPERVDSLLEFKTFFFLKGVQGNALSFLSAPSFLNSASDGNIGHLLSRD